MSFNSSFIGNFEFVNWDFNYYLSSIYYFQILFIFKGANSSLHHCLYISINFIPSIFIGINYFIIEYYLRFFNHLFLILKELLYDIPYFFINFINH